MYAILHSLCDPSQLTTVMHYYLDFDTVCHCHVVTFSVLLKVNHLCNVFSLILLLHLSPIQNTAVLLLGRTFAKLMEGMAQFDSGS